MSTQTNKTSKKLKNSDSDYKAEDQGSASDNPSLRKYKKAPYNLKLTKKQIVQNSIRTLVPIGVNLRYPNKLTSNQYQELMAVQDAQELSLNYKCMLGKVVQIIDGQTLKAAVFANEKPIKIILRLNGLNTPDVKKGQAKDFGNHVRKILKQMIESKIVRIETGEYDKSGKLFARIYAYTASPLVQNTLSQQKNCPEFCINDYLIQNDMAKGIQSKTKSQFTKKDYQQFCEKFQTKVWPATDNYPLQVMKQQQNRDYQQKQEEDDQLDE